MHSNKIAVVPCNQQNRNKGHQIRQGFNRDGLKEKCCVFMENTTLHGLRYISVSPHYIIKGLWLCVDEEFYDVFLSDSCWSGCKYCRADNRQFLFTASKKLH